jgi:hypothetical protein
LYQVNKTRAFVLTVGRTKKPLAAEALSLAIKHNKDTIMDIADIYEKFDQIGCLTFATIDKDTPQTRIAHLFAQDYEGLYFRTMITKPFYDQLKKTGKVLFQGNISTW